jgi:hypothetical protein
MAGSETWYEVAPGLNADLKQHVTRKVPMRSKPELKPAAISHMHRLAKSSA